MEFYLWPLTVPGDEDKPNCQNCIRKGLGCKYGIQLTFHGVNLLELNANEARELQEHAPTKYPSLQVVFAHKLIRNAVLANNVPSSLMAWKIYKMTMIRAIQIETMNQVHI
jgi:hypothetical protein